MHFQPNSAASAWMDLKELVASQDIDVLDKEGEPATEFFIELLEKEGEGASLRWLLASTTSEEHPMELRLQALPLPLSKLSKMPALLEDTAATCTLLQIPIAGKFFRSLACIGPVPILFSKDLEATAAWLKEDKQAEHNMCHRL